MKGVHHKEFLGEVIVQTGTLGIGRNLTCATPEQNICFQVDQTDNTLEITWETTDITTFMDCFDLNTEDCSWFGGPERYEQLPLEAMHIDPSNPWIVSKVEGSSIIEPYWLNSKGVYLYVNSITPLTISQNHMHIKRVCFIANNGGVYAGREKVILKYTIGVFENIRAAHLHAVNKFLGKPKDKLSELVTGEPIWSMWDHFKVARLTEERLLQTGNELQRHGYSGIIDIDDVWENCFGSLEFNKNKFKNVQRAVEELRKRKFTVRLWIHPFVNQNCEPTVVTGTREGYFVKDKYGNTSTSWWFGNYSNQIDFTNKKAAKWFTDRLHKIQHEHKIEHFKFDAGEVDYFNNIGVYPGVNVELVPNVATQKYVETCSEFRTMSQVRVGWKTQHLSMLVTMRTKISDWGINNGLKGLIATLLQMNINGYTYVLPDIIGGNGSPQKPDAELLVRWTQVCTFLPAMQFGYLPWEVKDELINVNELTKNALKLRRKHYRTILRAVESCVKTGTPVNPPVWWVEPGNSTAYKITDEFLVGEWILVAPVVEKGAIYRDIYIPTGRWQDGNSECIHIGPKIIKSYSAPIDVLPYFIKIG
ncbi:myogenesis-regulating glycosidase-like [Aethina tumida]|uniref:myogenesis-regulating glycosidase-like n=1 Tax=Aethina tumida TaxID=116153 RepID=UPI002147632C|nr:myogenesis-regulating glycosidase-like [Aethina tumida]